ncbi:MAG: type II toxin-antitoxin system RelE/ParE family toxin [Chloroflexi bacterium]|nr:type II toxin-antitoxin system RelE/ParE family toxin [Chloroflexota bacterium]
MRRRRLASLTKYWPRNSHRHDYRIVYEIDDSALVVTVWRIAHRREVYRP